RFHIDAELLSRSSVQIDGDLAHRMINVLRLRAGDEVLLFDGSGTDTRVRIESVAARALTARVLERAPGPTEPFVRVNLYQSITKGARFEWLIEKGTELGVARF